MKFLQSYYPLLVSKKCSLMKVFRLALYAFLAFFCTLLFKCGDEDEVPASPEGGAVSITADKTTVTFPSKGGDYDVKIAASGEWSVKEEISWLEATKVNNTLLKVTCEENTDAERSGEVTATIEEESIEITVTQSQPLGTLSKDKYTISGSEETNASLVLDVSFETAAAEWWITGADGAPIPTFTSPSPASDSKADTSSKTFTYSIDTNSTGTAIPVSLELHISGETGGASLTVLSFTVTQGVSLGTLSKDTYTISSAEATNATLVLDVSFETAAAEWWITGANGATIPTFTSPSPASDSKADTSSKTFTYSIGANSTDTAIPVSLELHISGETDGASLTVLPFTVTQDKQQITDLAPVSFPVSEASAGSHTFTFTSLTLTGSATHWWLTGDASLPASVSLSPDKDDKKVPGTTDFTVTLPRNETDQPRTYTLIFHAGSSATPSDPSLDARSFTVTQPARLASVASDALGPYHASGGDLRVDLSDAGTGLSLSFEDTSGDYWWISQTDGATTFSGELTNVSPSVARAQTDVSTLSFTLSPCTGNSGCSYNLMLNIATGMSAEATDQIPFTLTQSKALGSLGTMNYSLASGLASDETLTFMRLSFASEAAEWWITGQDGAAITAPLSSVSPDARSKAALDQNDLPNGFTYSIGANAGDAREIPLEIQIAAVAGEAPLTTLPFILTQDGVTLGALITVTDTISANGATRAKYLFQGLRFNSGTYWWITKANGVAIGDSDLITNVMPDNDNRRTHDAEKSFTYMSSDNTGNSDIDINLQIQIALSANADATTTLDFTITQSKPLISEVGTNDGIASAASGTYTVTFSDRMFAEGTKYWWLTGSSADRSLPQGVSVTVDAANKAPVSAITFDMTVPKNSTFNLKTFTLLLHAGTSGEEEEPSLHSKSFEVRQMEQLVSVASNTLGPYDGEGGNQSVDLSSSTAGEGLSLDFGTATSNYWWISQTNGNTTFSDGLTNVSPSSTRAQTNAAALTFTLGNCNQGTGCSYDLVLNVATGMRAEATDQISFTITQAAGPVLTLSKTTYTIPADANQSASVDFGENLKFRDDITHWWLTGLNESAISVLALISATGNSRALVDTKSFTMNAPFNSSFDSRELYQLEIHVGGESTPSQGSVAFTVTQAGKLTGLNQTSLIVPRDAGTNTEVTLKVEADADWTSAITYPTGTWSSDRVTLSKSRGSGTGNAETLMISYPFNSTGEVRTATITFTIGSTILTLTITQWETASGMIPIRNLDQLDAMRHDLNTDGKTDQVNTQSNYATAFPQVVYAPNKYTGYELTTDLDFDADGSYSDLSNKSIWTGNIGWSPIGVQDSPFTGTFDGGGHTISNLHINYASLPPSGPEFMPTFIGLFGEMSGIIKNVSLADPDVTSDGIVGTLVGAQSGGMISQCYVSGGSIVPGNFTFVIGGLVGFQNGGEITQCYVSKGSITPGVSTGQVGGLVGQQNVGTISACYVFQITATASDTGVAGTLIGNQVAGTKLIASYAGGTDYAISLVGEASGEVTNSYNQESSSSDDADTEVSEKTESALKTPDDYTGIYVDWDDLDGDTNTDTERFWNFGTSNQYPVLEVDFNNDGQTSDDVTAQHTDQQN